MDNFLSGTINEAEDRKTKDDVNPAKNRTLGALVHDVVMYDFVPNKASGRESLDLSFFFISVLSDCLGVPSRWVDEAEDLPTEKKNADNAIGPSLVGRLHAIVRPAPRDPSVRAKGAH